MTTYSVPIPSFPGPDEQYRRENEAQFRRQLERSLLDVTMYIEGLIADPVSVAEHVIATTSAIGDRHTVSGLAAGTVLRASGATAVAFAELQHDDLGGVGADDHHAQAHLLTGGPHTESGLDSGDFLRALTATTFGFVTVDLEDLDDVVAYVSLADDEVLVWNTGAGGWRHRTLEEANIAARDHAPRHEATAGDPIDTHGAVVSDNVTFDNEGHPVRSNDFGLCLGI